MLKDKQQGGALYVQSDRDVHSLKKAGFQLHSKNF